MPVGSSLDAKLRVKEATDIVDLVGSYLQLRREGRILKALCPWHDDTRPSLQVNPERQSFKCWVCDIGGDIFSFVMKIENVAFPEALELLADRAGIALGPRGARSADGPPDEKRQLREALAWAVYQYHACLLTDPIADAARTYLVERGISLDSVKSFRLGFAPADWSWLLERARSTSFAPALLEKSGLVGRRRSGDGYYDRFMGRVLFPIRAPQGHPIGIGGRVLPGEGAGEAAKYINSPETPLFRKHEVLYALDTARDAIRRTGVALIMEGYTDCIVAHQAGFANSVAVLGTALGLSHIRLLRQQAGDVRMVLVLDGDEAGRRRANEVLELFVAADADLRVLTLPAGADPCDFLQVHGAGALESLIADAPDALDHAIHVATAGIDLQRDVHAASQALEQLVATIAKASRPSSQDSHLRTQKFLGRLARDFGVPEEQIRQRLMELRGSRRTADVKTNSASVSAIDPCERELLELLLQAPEALARLSPVVRAEELSEGGCREIYETSLQLAARGESPGFERLLLEIDDPKVKNLLVELDERARLKTPEEKQVWLEDVLAHFERRKAEPRRRAQTAALHGRRLKEDEELAVLLEIEQMERTRRGIHAPTDG